MTCHDARDLFSALVDETLGADERGAFDAHLATCADCRRELQRFKDTVALLRAVEPARAPAGFVDRVLAAARPVPWPRRLLRSTSPRGSSRRPVWSRVRRWRPRRRAASRRRLRRHAPSFRHRVRSLRPRARRRKRTGSQRSTRRRGRTTTSRKRRRRRPPETKRSSAPPVSRTPPGISWDRRRKAVRRLRRNPRSSASSRPHRRRPSASREPTRRAPDASSRRLPSRGSTRKRGGPRPARRRRRRSRPPTSRVGWR